MADWLKRGGRRTGFKGHKNFTHKAAQKRIDEAVSSMHRKNENALAIDSHEVLIFKQTKGGLGKPCTCSSDHVEPEVMDAIESEDEDMICDAPQIAPSNSKMDGIKVKLRKDNLFGDQSEAHKNIEHGDSGVKVTELGDLDYKVQEPVNSAAIDSLDPDLQIYYRDGFLSGNSVACGICFRKGKQPAYECHDHFYELFTTYNIDSMQGYHIDESAMPTTFNRVAEEGYVVFTTDVPKFFTGLTYSVRNNEDVITFEHILDLKTGEPVTIADIDPYRGKTYSFKVLASLFTHVVLLFDLGMQPILGNISEEGNRLDPDTEDTTGSLTVVLPARAGEIRAGDILYLPKRRLTLKVLDAPRKRTANDHIIEWMLSTRTVQSHEAIRHIAKGYKAV